MHSVLSGAQARNATMVARLMCNVNFNLRAFSIAGGALNYVQAKHLCIQKTILKEKYSLHLITQDVSVGHQKGKNTTTQ